MQTEGKEITLPSLHRLEKIDKYLYNKCSTLILPEEAMFGLHLIPDHDPKTASILEDIYSNYKNQMFFIAKSVVHNDADAEDAVSDALLAIAKQLKSLPHQDPKLVRAYVLTAARNSALNIRDRSIDQFCEKITNIDDHRLSADDRLFEKVTASVDYNTLARAMNKLPIKYREVMLLRYVYEMKHREISEFLGRNQSTVHQQITKGRKMLIELCKEEGMCFDD